MATTDQPTSAVPALATLPSPSNSSPSSPSSLVFLAERSRDDAVRAFRVLRPRSLFGFSDYFALVLALVVGALHLFQILRMESVVFYKLGAIYAFILGLRYWLLRGSIEEESLVVMRELGVQINTRYRSGRVKSLFVDKAQIRAIVLNEGITGGAVIFYLAFVVNGRDNLLVAFENLLPRFEVLKEVYRGARALIYNEPE